MRNFLLIQACTVELVSILQQGSYSVSKKCFESINDEAVILETFLVWLAEIDTTDYCPYYLFIIRNGALELHFWTPISGSGL